MSEASLAPYAHSGLLSYFHHLAIPLPLLLLPNPAQMAKYEKVKNSSGVFDPAISALKHKSPQVCLLAHFL